MREPRILVLEDDVQRRSLFDRWYSKYEIDVTDNVKLATEWLAQHHYDLIFLDHDLTEEHYYEALADDGLTGYVVAVWLAENPQCQTEARIIIHSLNYSGSDRMLEILRRAGRRAEHIPFPCLSAQFDELLS